MNQLLKKKQNQLKAKKGFTLVELIIVIAIIAILAAIAVPKFGEIKHNSNKASDIANAKNISMAVSKAIAEDKVDYSKAITNATLDNVGGANIEEQIDGITSSTKLKTKGYTNQTFVVDVTTEGNVIVKSSGTPASVGVDAVAGTQIYPEIENEFK